MRKYERRRKRRRRRYIAKKKNKEPYLRANIRSYLLTKKKNWKINVYIFVLNKTKTQNRDIKRRTIERKQKPQKREKKEYVQVRNERSQ